MAYNLDEQVLIDFIKSRLGTYKQIKIKQDDPDLLAIPNVMILLSSASLKDKAMKEDGLALGGMVSGGKLMADVLIMSTKGGGTAPETKPEETKPEIKKNDPPKKKEEEKRGDDGFIIRIPSNVYRCLQLINGGIKILRFVGPMGCGKSQAAFWIAELMVGNYDKYPTIKKESRVPVVVISCSPEIPPSHIFGKYLAKEGSTIWQEGQLETALKIGLDKEGNEVSPGAVLVFDEFTSLPPSISLRLNGFLADTNKRKEFTFDNGQRIKAHSDLVVITTSNTFGTGSGDRGHIYAAQTGMTDASTLDRFKVTEVFDYSRVAEKAILEEYLEEDDVKMLVNFIEGVRDCVKKGELERTISTRQIKDWCEVYQALGKNRQGFLESTLVKWINPLLGEAVVCKKFNDLFQNYVKVDILKEFKIEL